MFGTINYLVNELTVSAPDTGGGAKGASQTAGPLARVSPSLLRNIFQGLVTPLQLSLFKK